MRGFAPKPADQIYTPQTVKDLAEAKQFLINAANIFTEDVGEANVEQYQVIDFLKFGK